MTKTKNKYVADSDFVRDLLQGIRTFIQAGTEQPDTDGKFDELALCLFEYQYNTNEPYQKYCQKRGVVPGEINTWADIPAVASNAFKEIPLCNFPPEQAVKVFLSSGTTNPEKRSKVHLNQTGLDFLDLSYEKSVEAFFYASPFEKFHALLMTPSPDSLPHDAVILHTPKKIIENHHIGEPQFFISRAGLDSEGLVKRLRQAEEDGEPVMILGASFGFVHFFEYCLENNLSFKLPEGSRSFDGAGYKGRSRELSKADYMELANQITGIEPRYLINNFGMSELQAVLPDNVLYNHVRGVEEPRYKINPPWTRTVVVDPDTLEPLPKGKQGLLRHYCLANVVTVQALQTDDIGYEIGAGFEIVGRAKGAEARGCSIAVDELINAQSS